MTSKRSKASSDTVIIKQCFVRLDKNFLLHSKQSKRKAGDDAEIGGSEENDRNVAQENVSKKPKPKQDIESSESESKYSESEENDRNVAYENKSKKLKPKQDIESSGSDSEYSGSEENDRNVAQKNVSKKPKPKQDIESSGSESEYSGNETSESDESENTTLSKRNKKKQLQLNKDKHEEANRKSLACKICKEKFKTYNSFMKHQFSHKAKVFRCTNCKESFKHRTSYMNHQKKEHPERACYPCEFSGCDASFRTLARRRNHEKCHYKYMCRFCKRGYAKKAYMRLHVKEVHSTKI